jgi:hypothetical protein
MPALGLLVRAVRVQRVHDPDRPGAAATHPAPGPH